MRSGRFAKGRNWRRGYEGRPTKQAGNGDSPHFQMDLLSLRRLRENGDSPRSDAPGISVSRRARRLSIRVYPDARVEVVVPPRARPREVEHFVAAHREWIESEARPGVAQPAGAGTVSARERSSFALTGERWRLHVAGGTGKTARVARHRRRHACEVSGSRPRRQACARALRAWLLRAARRAARAARRGAGSGHRRDILAGFHPPAAFALGKLFGARYHQPQLPACCSSGPKWSTTSSSTSSCTSST